MGWENNRKLDDNYFKLCKVQRGLYTLQHYLDQIQLDNYWVYKSSDRFRRVDNVNGEYSGYIFFNKKLYDHKHIDQWIKFIKDINIEVKYLVRPFPRLEIQNKIEVI